VIASSEVIVGASLTRKVAIALFLATRCVPSFMTTDGDRVSVTVFVMLGAARTLGRLNHSDQLEDYFSLRCTVRNLSRTAIAVVARFRTECRGESFGDALLHLLP
jgi:hypothetical protein